MPHTPANLKTGLTLHLPGDYYSTTAYDVSGNGYNGGLVDTTPIRNNVQKGFGFNGTSSRIACSSNVKFTASDSFTFSFWLKIPSGDANYAAIIGWVNDYQFGGIGFWKWDNNTPFLSLQDTGNRSISVNPSITITDNVWRHFVFTYSNKTATLYINLVSFGSSSNTNLSGNLYGSTVDNQIGCKRSTAEGAYHQFLNGFIANPRVYNRILGPDEMRQIFYSEFIK